MAFNLQARLASGRKLHGVAADFEATLRSLTIDFFSWLTLPASSWSFGGAFVDFSAVFFGFATGDFLRRFGSRSANKR